MGVPVREKRGVVRERVLVGIGSASWSLPPMYPERGVRRALFAPHVRGPTSPGATDRPCPSAHAYPLRCPPPSWPSSTSCSCSPSRRSCDRVLARVRQPPVMAEVLAGLVLGASALGALPGDGTAALFTPEARELLTALGEIALVAYVFAVGGELDMAALRRERRAVALVAAGSYVVPGVAGAALALAIHDDVAGDPPLTAFVLFLGTALAVTAFPVLARIVDAHGLAGRRAGRVALTSAAGQELLIWPSLAVALALAGAGERTVAESLALAGLALAAVLSLARGVVPALARSVPRLAGPAALVALALAAAATELAGLHLVLGAFLLGAALPVAPRAAALELLRTRPAALASAALLPLFFALPALRVDVWLLGADGLGVSSRWSPSRWPRPF